MEKDGISLGVQLNLENQHSELWPCFSFSGHRLESNILLFHVITGFNSLNSNTNICYSFTRVDIVASILGDRQQKKFRGMYAYSLI